MKYGCIGEKLGHSFSKEIHNRLADYTYELKELSREELGPFMEAREFSAINVTIPYKQDVIPYLSEISPQAKAIGAVNTIVNRNGKLYGYNTDFFGMRALILRAGMDLKGRKVVIFGRGGTSRTAQAVAADLGAAEIIVASRSGLSGITYEQAKTTQCDADFIINTTPCGMYPNIHTVAMDLDSYTNLKGVVDVVYNPLRTELVLRARERGIPAVCGLYMLVAQAAYAVEYFLDTKISVEKIEEVFREIFSSKQNIVLTGMPGSGKTTIGQKVAEALGRSFLDTDVLLTERAGASPAEIIPRDGEQAFRDLEGAVIDEQAAPLTGCVIATGGGAILRDQNVKNLKRNGRVIFLDRPLEEILPTDDRPLSSSREALEKRYRERYSRYCETADHIISPASDISAVCNEILEDIKHENSCD
ncbi:MAG: shikimate dehydrogenase [Clostridia bacterium]|nr:shikimate dehydrogenase [Clostridia bacterium]